MKKATPEQKLKELIVYISSKCASDPKYGKTKLNKILFFSDFLYYQKKLKPISEVKYRHLPYGPVPDDIDKLIKTMLGKDIDVAYVTSGRYTKHKFFAKREADLSSFEPAMIAHVDSIIEDVCGENSMTGTQLSDLTHEESIGYIVTSQGQEIPYSTVFLKDKRYQKATVWEKEKAKELAKEFAGQYGYPTAS
jgi:hypothetical protein